MAFPSPDGLLHEALYVENARLRSSLLVKFWSLSSLGQLSQLRGVLPLLHLFTKVALPISSRTVGQSACCVAVKKSRNDLS